MKSLSALETRIPLVGIPCYRHLCSEMLGGVASAMPDSYMRALLAAGAAPVLVPVVDGEAALRRVYASLDGLLLAGGPDVDPVRYGEQARPQLRRVTPERDRLELELLEWALADDLPVFGICRGIQVLNVALGGSLWQDIAAQVPEAQKHDYHPGYPESRRSHAVEVAPASRLASRIGTGEFWVNSLHHQAIGRLGRGLRVTAQAPDGIIEAVEMTACRWVLGVQWHPEWMVPEDPGMRGLFEGFAAACATGH
jgi:putative glutamine amidotransferase